MATTEIPPARSEPPATDAELHEIPVLVVQLQDDLARSRLREAFWMSVVFHLLLVIILVNSPRWLAFQKPIPVQTTADLLRDKELTYLELPHDEQKVEKPPNTDRISDKNRIATKRPTLDRKTLDELRDSARAGAPGQPAPVGPPPQPMAPPQAAQAQPGPQAPSAGAPPPPPQPQTQTQARLEPPLLATKPGFSAGRTAGETIQQAARAAASTRVGGAGVSGGGGDYGLGPSGTQGRIHSDLDILSDTMGVDFGPYLSRVLHDVRLNWYNLIPEIARAPIMKKGKVSIEFAILKNGQVAGLRLIGPSGDVSLDRAAWGGITGSNPFPPLPNEFQGSYLALRFHFYYNPDRNQLE